MDTAVIVGLIVGVLGPAATLLAVYVGANLNQRQLSVREVRDRRTIRKLLRKECEYNIAALLDYWEKVSRAGVHIPGRGQLMGIGTSHEEGGFDTRQRLAWEPVPIWQSLVWRSRVELAASALTRPGELDRVYQLYIDLDAFTMRRDELREVMEDTTEGRAMVTEYNMRMVEKWEHRTHMEPNTYKEAQGLEVKLGAFNVRTYPLWDACRKVADRAAVYRHAPIIDPDDDAQVLGWWSRLTGWLPQRGAGEKKPKEIEAK